MSTRELVILVTELEQVIADVEEHGCGATMQVNQRLLADVRQELSNRRRLARRSGGYETARDVASRLVVKSDGRSPAHRERSVPSLPMTPDPTWSANRWSTD